jgi:hypothetical protein
MTKLTILGKYSAKKVYILITSAIKAPVIGAISSAAVWKNLFEDSGSAVYPGIFYKQSKHHGNFF